MVSIRGRACGEGDRRRADLGGVVSREKTGCGEASEGRTLASSRLRARGNTTADSEHLPGGRLGQTLGLNSYSEWGVIAGIEELDLVNEKSY